MAFRISRFMAKHPTKRSADTPDDPFVARVGTLVLHQTPLRQLLLLRKPQSGRIKRVRDSRAEQASDGGLSVVCLTALKYSSAVGIDL
jgi:hypothetical protein